jgi:hypothetical protein
MIISTTDVMRVIANPPLKHSTSSEDAQRRRSELPLKHSTSSEDTTVRALPSPLQVHVGFLQHRSPAAAKDFIKFHSQTNLRCISRLTVWIDGCDKHEVLGGNGDSCVVQQAGADVDACRTVLYICSDRQVDNLAFNFNLSQFF